ncbi:uncharacterized protein [Argopecten irradians]|uniref:uncharacterized protein n=1 Tax=Argopecten irradians TaxID=31199 RepID=UPI00371C47F0
MAAKYPESDDDEDCHSSSYQLTIPRVLIEGETVSEARVQTEGSTVGKIPVEGNTVADASDTEEIDFKGSQVAFYRSWSEGSDGSNSNASLNVESSNFAKLFLLSSNICQDVMREIIRKKNPEGSTDADLHKLISNSEMLRKKVDHYTSEAMLLFPKGGETVRYNQLDFSAMYKVVRYALPNQIAPCQSWITSPKPGSECLVACIEKLRKFRNDCSHSASGSISKPNFQVKVNEITSVIIRIEHLLKTPKKFSHRVRRLTKASLSPRTTELEARSVNLEREIKELKGSLVKQTEITGLFSEWKKHQQELLEVHSKLEDLYKASTSDVDEELPLVQRNLNAESIGESMRETFRDCLAEEDFFCETNGTRKAKKYLDENHWVIIAGRKGNGKERLAHHLVLSLMSETECQTHVLDGVNDVRHCFKQKSHETVVVLISDVLIDEATKRTITKLSKEFFKGGSKKYLVITSLYTKHLAGLSNLVNLSTKQFELTSQEKTNILKAHLNQRAEEEHISRNRLSEREINEIVKMKCSLEFPLACALFTSKAKYYSKGVLFFRYPIDYFLGELKSLAEDPSRKLFFDLLLRQHEGSPFHFVNGNQSNDINDVDLVRRLQRDDLDLSDLAEIGEDLAREGILIHKLPNTQKAFTFSNETVEKAAQIWLLETNFSKALDLLSSETLLYCVEIDPGLEETCLYVPNSRDNKSRIAEKVIDDILSKRVSETIWDSSLRNWYNKEFVDLLAEILVKRLENKSERYSIVSSILTKCVTHRLHGLCKALVERLRKATFFESEYTGLVSQALLKAAQVHGNMDVLKELIKNGADISFCKKCANRPDTKHKCALEHAAEANDQDAIHFLLQSGATIPHSKWKFWNFLKVAAKSQDTFVCNDTFIKQLSVCCRSKVTTVNTKMDEFVERSLTLNPDDEYDRNQLFFNCLLLVGIDHNLHDVFKSTVIHTQKLPKDNQGENSCHKILDSFLDPDMEFRTLGTLANVEFDMLNERNNSGWTPLLKAVSLQKSDRILSQMLLQNANADITDSNGRTALHLAISSQYPDTWVLQFVKALSGPTIKCMDITSATHLRLCLEKGRHRIGTLQQLLALHRKEGTLPTSLVHDCLDMSLTEEEMLETLSVLKQVGADPNTEDSCKSKPLAKAMKLSYFSIVITLLEWKAEVEDIDSQQNTLLHYCSLLDAPSGQKLLDGYSKYHPNNDVIVNRKNETGKNAIMAYLAEPTTVCSTSILWRLLNMEPDLTLQDENGNTALHYLMQSTLPDEDVLDFTQVMVNDLFASVSICNKRSLSPLMAAFTAGKSRYNTVKFLLSMQEYQTPIQSTERGVLHHCITSCMEDEEVHEISEILIHQCGISTHESDDNGLSPFLASIKHQSSRCKTIALILKCSSRELCDVVLSDLIKHNRLDADILQAIHTANIPIFKPTEKQGYSIFHFLLHNASHSLVFHDLLTAALLFEHDINHIDSEGLSPLFHACRDTYPESVVTWFLMNGARGHISTRHESALHLCIRSKRNDTETMNIVRGFLRNKCVAIDACDSYHTTPLAEAVCQGKLVTTKVLLEHGADPNLPDRENRTVLHHSVAGKWSDQKACAFLQLFLPLCQIDRKDGDDRTALHVAAAHDSFSRIFSILKLLTAGSKTKMVDRLGRSPLHNTLKLITSNVACCKLERLCRIQLFLHFGISPICKDDNGEKPIDICKNKTMLDEIRLLNKELDALEPCEQILSMLQVGENGLDPELPTFTEDSGKRVITERMFNLMEKIAYQLHDIDMSSC